MIAPSRASARRVNMANTQGGGVSQTGIGADTGTKPNSKNSFVVLSDDYVHSRALEMGVDPDSFNLEKS